MPLIELSTVISAPPERVFDLTRSIDAHQDSTEETDERAVAGVTRGLLRLDDEVTWEARHLGVRQRLSIRVTVFDRPRHFQDVMVAGAFKHMKHDHEFLKHPNGTLMIDRFEFSRHTASWADLLTAFSLFGICDVFSFSGIQF